MSDKVKYLNRDFPQLRQSLIDYVKNYFSDIYNDFDSNDPGMMFIEMAAYVGDVLSYYIDNQFKESLLLHAEERKNVTLIAQSLGYKPKTSVPSKTKLEVYQLLPSTGIGIETTPDFDYAMRINAGMRIASKENSGNVFRTTEAVDFAFSSSYDSTDVSVYQVDTNGAPTYYLVKKQTTVEAGQSKTLDIDITDQIKYLKINIPEEDIIQIDSITDSDGNIWYEVPYLAQDTILKSVSNVSYNDHNLSQYSTSVPYLLKYQRVLRRFITRHQPDNTMTIQFGAGINNEITEEIIPNPDNVGLATPSRMSKLNNTYDIANFIYSNSYGMIPENTTLTIKYSTGGGISSNVKSNVLTSIEDVAATFQASTINTELRNSIRQTLATDNPEPAVGGRDEESIDEIRNNALAYFAAQGRTVTKEDYINRVYSMPQKFGSISKAYIVQDEQISFNDLLKTNGAVRLQENDRIKNPLAMNLYVLSYDNDKHLVNANTAIKENLMVYLDKHRMLTDAINIKNAYVVNIEAFYDITVLPNYSAKEVQLKCNDVLKTYFDIEKWQINQPIIIADIISLLASTDGVQSVLDVKFQNKLDSTLGYWNNAYDIQSATRNNIIYPSKDPMIFEVRFPDSDIYGKTTTY